MVVDAEATSQLGMNEHNNSKADMSAGYSLGRWAARQWVNSKCGKIRLLRPEALNEAGRVLLVLNGHPNFKHAAAVAAVLARTVRILVPKDACSGLREKWIASQLGVIWSESDRTESSSVHSAARDSLGRGEAVAIFAEMEPERSESLSPTCVVAAKLALDAGAATGRGITIIPLHALSSYGESAAGELLIAAGAPINPGEFQGGASAEASLRTLAGEVEDALAMNPFRLEERDVRFFLSDLEGLLLADLKEDWASRAKWKQQTEGFELSRFLIEFAEELNLRDPSALGGLRLDVERYREELRLWSLKRAEVETADEWLQSSASRARYWLEAILEAPIAFYGFVNHLLPIALLMPGNLLGRLARKDPGQAWLLRIIVVLGTYILLVSICAREWGRAIAGYYTLTLPVSGLVLWRFTRIARTRIRLLLLARTTTKRGEKLRQVRKRFIERLNRARDQFASTMIVHH